MCSRKVLNKNEKNHRFNENKNIQTYFNAHQQTPFSYRRSVKIQNWSIKNRFLSNNFFVLPPCQIYTQYFWWQSVLQFLALMWNFSTFDDASTYIWNLTSSPLFLCKYYYYFFNFFRTVIFQKWCDFTYFSYFFK